jgi:putative ABC transport system substrate-binding protein
MRRREFITLLGGAAAAWPVAARAQQQAMPVIGFLHTQSPEQFPDFLNAFRKGLSELGFVENRNLAIEYRWAKGNYDLLPALTAELIARPVAVIATGGGAISAQAAKAATSSIPIVFVSGGDPVQLGLVVSLNRPGGNVTGVSPFVNVLGAKRLELLLEIVPSVNAIGVILNPRHPEGDKTVRDVTEAGRSLGQTIHVITAGSEDEIDAAFADLAKLPVGAIIVATDPFFTVRRAQILGLAARYSLPAIYDTREYATAGGLMAYGTSIPDAYRQLGIYVARILRGEKPDELPIMQPTKFELVINLKTAKSLGLVLPPTLLVSADEVIE